jgi:hypothetical protein
MSTREPKKQEEQREKSILDRNECKITETADTCWDNYSAEVENRNNLILEGLNHINQDEILRIKIL